MNIQDERFQRWRRGLWRRVEERTGEELVFDLRSIVQEEVTRSSRNLTAKGITGPMTKELKLAVGEMAKEFVSQPIDSLQKDYLNWLRENEEHWEQMEAKSQSIIQDIAEYSKENTELSKKNTALASTMLKESVDGIEKVKLQELLTFMEQIKKA